MRLAIRAVNPTNTAAAAAVPNQTVMRISSSRSPPTISAQSGKLMSSCKQQLRVTNSWNSLGSESAGRVATRVAKLGQKWMEYQGSKNWEGLLDPLDDGLRGEILRYGEFVEAAYRSFEFDTSSPNYATCKYNKNSMLSQCGLGGSGYKVTRNLRATCGIEFPSWVDGSPSWMSTKSSWIGYVAVCDDKEEIARLGRRDVVIAFRGTATCLEWIENLRAKLTHLPCCKTSSQGQKNRPMAESGFLSMYTSATATCPSLRDMVREEISRLLQVYGDEPLSVTITGHSLGAALATLTAYDITSTFEQSPLVTVVSFGGPRVGNRNFRCQLEKTGTRILRIVNSTDLITKMPGFLIDNNEVVTNQFPSWLRKRMEDKQWQYADVGKELRLSSNDSPYLAKSNIATCHDLKTYLHLVEGFVSSTCPFRATARRFLNGGPQPAKEQVLVR